MAQCLQKDLISHLVFSVLKPSFQLQLCWKTSSILEIPISTAIYKISYFGLSTSAEGQKIRSWCWNPLSAYSDLRSGGRSCVNTVCACICSLYRCRWAHRLPPLNPTQARGWVGFTASVLGRFDLNDLPSHRVRCCRLLAVIFLLV